MMSTSFRAALSAFFVAGALGLASISAAQAESVMKECGDDWKAAKANNTTNGLTWPQFLKQCRTEKEGAVTTRQQSRQHGFSGGAVVGDQRANLAPRPARTDHAPSGEPTAAQERATDMPG